MKERRKPEFIAPRVAEARYFFMDLEPCISSDLTIVGGGCEHCLPGYLVEREDFPYFSIEYVHQGKGSFSAGGQTTALSAGTVFTYGPGRAHRIESDPEAPLIKYFFDFVGDAGQDLIDEIGLTYGSTVMVSIPQRMLEICESILSNGTADTTHSPRICATLLQLLMLKVSENSVSGDMTQGRAYSTYLRCRLVLDERFQTLKGLEDFAQCCHVEPAYLCRLFARFDELSPYQRLIRLKMNRAAELLSGGRRLVKEVAAELDYDDPYHFSRVFKRVHGLSPEHFVYRSARLG